MTKSNHSRGRSSVRVSVRLSPEERQALEQAAKGKTLSAYIRQKLLSADTINTETIRLSPQARQKLLAQILASLGKSNLSVSLKEIAEAAKLGLLPLTEDVLADIKTATTQIKFIRKILLKALGLKPRGGDK